MEEGGVVALSKLHSHRPKLEVTPRDLSNGFVRGGLNSATPTPMIYGSSLHADTEAYADYKPFSSLLAGAWTPTAFTNNLANKRMLPDMPTNEEDGKLTEIELNGMGGEHVDSQCIGGARYKAMMPSRLPITSSASHLTISPGISPASLLESPILFSMVQTDPSPTTGSYYLPPITHERESLDNVSVGEDGAKSPERNDSFIFKPHLLEERYGSPANIGMGTFGICDEEAAKHFDGQWHPHMRLEQLYNDDVPPSDQQQASSLSSPQDNVELTSMASPANRPPHMGLTSYVSRVTNHSNGRLSIDEYNWKKYGQKALKNSKNPRSYYKCTHPNCPAKRQVECSLEGEITEIMYKGKHNHAKPAGNRRRAKNGNAIVAQNSEGACQDSMAASKIKHEKAFGDLSSSSFGHSHGGTPELSFTSPSDEDDENGEASMGLNDGEDEHHSKRRRIEGEKEIFPRESFRATRESRVVVQTVSEKEILDDGYRWRKYGQKVVKSQLFPRHYYRCTNVGCSVRKTVERSSTDAKCVMTTYEGKHNHGVPPARGSLPEKEEASTAFDASHLHTDSEGISYTF